MVAGGGRVWLLRGCAWLLVEGGHAWLPGGCMVKGGSGKRGGVHGEGGGMRGIRRHTEIRSMSGGYASYWNAFLFPLILNRCFCFVYQMHIFLITVRKRSCGKVMFSQACVKNSVHREGRCTPPWPDTHGQTHTPSDGHCSGWYAPYWNAFLLFFFFCPSRLIVSIDDS